LEILYIASKEKKGIHDSGVQKKIIGQVKALNYLGINTTLVRLPILNKKNRMFPFSSSSINWNSIQVNASINGLYIRYLQSDYRLLTFLRRVKTNYPKIKIIIEIPTYPYNDEKKNFLIVIRDTLYRRFLNRYVDCIAVFTKEYRNIFNIPTICMRNGIDLDKVKIRKPINRMDHSIHILSVSNFQIWHGMDRMLLGLISYYKNGGKINIVLHLAGEGSVISDLKETAKNEHLHNHIIFEGYLDGKKLDDLYDYCDLGLGSLGGHRRKIKINSELKSREYLAKGIPFIYAGLIDVFVDEPVDFAYSLPLSDSPIDIQEIIDFYHSLLNKYNIFELTNIIREYSVNNIDMRQTMKPIRKYLID